MGIWSKNCFDAGKISVPTLVIRGGTDLDAKREDNQQLMEYVGGSTVKEYVESIQTEVIFFPSRM